MSTTAFLHNKKLHNGGLQRLHFDDDFAVNWQEGTAMKALARLTE